MLLKMCLVVKHQFVSWLIFNLTRRHFCVSHRPDTTKVDLAIPLRENWALPYFSCQVAALTGFLSNNISSATEVGFHFLLIHFLLTVQAHTVTH